MPIPRALVAVIVVVGLFQLIDIFTIKSDKFSKLTLSDPTLIVKYGKFVDRGLEKARLDQKEFYSYMHINGIANIKEIKLFYLEVNDQISFIRKK